MPERSRRFDMPLYHHFDRHWNAAGHRYAAEILLEELARLGIPSRSGRPTRDPA